ncbi:hypothetical protein CEXT_84381 [Caerostris extrusa]|uniref:Uncharacterized protein n=1 Tax=Caerostris extrusa TaxID=172846 RepID=A0AAV4UW90_CAEEX|nr:hypothetical protein CEXT_84381 [Caerostris extrusa]
MHKHGKKSFIYVSSGNFIDTIFRGSNTSCLWIFVIPDTRSYKRFGINSPARKTDAFGCRPEKDINVKMHCYTSLFLGKVIHWNRSKCIVRIFQCGNGTNYAISYS